METLDTSQPTQWDSRSFCPTMPADCWGVQQGREVSLQIPVPSELVSDAVPLHSFVVGVLTIPAAHSPSLSYITCFASVHPLMLWLLPGYGWPKLNATLRMRLSMKLSELSSGSLLSLLAFNSVTHSTVSHTLVLEFLGLSFSIFLVWWQHLRCDKRWSEKSQSSYLSVTRIQRHISFKR
jgi:hypothetical protein